MQDCQRTAVCESKEGQEETELVFGRKICFRIQRPHPFSSLEGKRCTGKENGKGGVGDLGNGICGDAWRVCAETLSIGHAAQLSSLWVSL